MKPQSTKGDPKPRASFGRFWWVLLIALMAWSLAAFLPRGPSPASITYSDFLAQVRAGNVTQVTIASDQISGSFAKPTLWPPATATPSAGAAAQSGSSQAQTYTTFQTTFPSSVGDPTLLPLLESQGVTVDASSSSSSPWLGILLTTGLPVLLLIGMMVWMGRRMSQSQSGVMGIGQSKARRYDATRPQITFADVAGAEEAKADLRQIVDFLRNPRKYYAIGARIPRGVLLVGPPGTGKTLLARAVAGEAGVPFFSISASEFVEMFVGVGASRVRDLFKQAKETTPGIVFIDELDAVGRRRGAGIGNTNDEREQTLNQLLVEMDGFDESHEIVVLAATNRPDVLDPALLRPGRFDRQVVVDLPDRKGRQEILGIHVRKLGLAPDVDLGVLSGQSTGMSGADLANLCNEAALYAARRDHDRVTMRDFEDALDKTVLGEARGIVMSPRDREVVAYHEAGHALVAWLSPSADPVHKVTIIPRGRALGVTEQVPQEDRYNYSREYLTTRLAVMLGGRSAEEIAIGDVTTGAENDLVQATRLARRMVTRWGMGSIGTVAFDANSEQPFLGYELTQGRDYGQALADQIDRDVQDLLEAAHETAKRLVSDARWQLDALVEALTRDETVGEADLIRVLGQRPAQAEPADSRRPVLVAASSG